MRPILDAAYVLLGLLSTPLWLWLILSGRHRADLGARVVGPAPVSRSGERPRVLIHAVSVGEVNAIRLLVERLEALDEPPGLVIAATTDTGLDRARDLFGDRHEVIRFPLDFSWAVGRLLDSVEPATVALVELEIWPNLLSSCRGRGIPVAVINGRLSRRSFRSYRRFRWLLGTTFAKLSEVGARSAEDAERFTALGLPASHVHVAGEMKWDAVDLAPDESAAAELAEAMGIDRDRPLVVAGSTAPEEHELLRDAVPEGVQLLCAPRRPEWFDGAARALPGCVRRSSGERGSETHRFLLDTIGELRQAYALADVVVVGRTFCERHGSDMMEPVGLGKATVVGPSVTDFRETVDVLLEAGGLIQVEADALPAMLTGLLEDSTRRADLVERGQAAIRSRQGATGRYVEMLTALLHAPKNPPSRW